MSWPSSYETNRRPLQQNAADDRMVLDFQEAMHTFRAMFPNLDEDVIEQVLRNHNGSVDATIESLLKISSTSEPQRSSSHNRSSHLTAAPASASYTIEDVSDSLIQIGFTDEMVSHSRWKPAMLRPLPKDFLVIPGIASNFGNSSSSGLMNNLTSDTLTRRMRENEELRANGIEDGEIQAFLEDERLAIMLQNEEFVKMLSQDEEFMEAMNREQGLSGSRHYSSVPSSTDHPHYHESRRDELSRIPDAFPYAGAASSSSGSSKHRRFDTKLMSKSTKVKLAKMAKKFFSRKTLSGKRSGTGLPIESNKGTQGLLEDDELANSSSQSQHYPSSNGFGRL